ncbi:hypothetical protein C7S20_09125 [Christiangramia fulva]|uniref:Uncharacterized protein n=1 Tax=Christiangramia fulva TaxID=2126553 RepID=A0A2R3Z577_9FLAO|nr:hypothetical protein [Christiangramia fulva]AVR45420.1 hypothetical protein C7S20_09125 [Christiangramia fulva]
MIKFFRKVRRRLLGKNQFTRYIIYAIGEIILVVIGILIALQVNNWNAEQKSEKQRQSLISDLKEEIQKGHSQFNLFKRLNTIYITSDSILQLIQEGEITEKEYRENKELLFPMFSRQQENLFLMGDQAEKFIKTETAEIILQKRSEYSEKYEQLLYYLKLYQSTVANLKSNMNRVSENQNEFMQYMLDHYPWFYASDSLSIEKAIAFSLKNTNYKTRVKLFRRNYDLLNKSVTSARASQAVVMGELVRLHSGKVSDIENAFSELGYLPMKLVSCADDSTEIRQANLFQFNPIYNATDHPVNIHRLDPKYRIFETFELPSKGFVVFGQAEGTLFQVDENEQCAKRFKVKRSSYLIVD